MRLQFALRLAAAWTTLNGHRSKHGSADFGRRMHQQEQEQVHRAQGAPAVPRNNASTAAAAEAESGAPACASGPRRVHLEQE